MSNTEQNEDRLRRNTSGDRESRAMTDRAISENREMTDEERIELFATQHFQHVLPDLPKIPGYHVCWLSTTNQSDSIHARQRLGYEPIRREDVPGWAFDTFSLKTGEHAGLIAINEMVAFKLKESLYQAYMTQAHHKMPAQQDEKLIHDVEQYNELLKANKTYIETFDGQKDIKDGLQNRTPTFE